jgi:hypothetical protein
MPLRAGGGMPHGTVSSSPAMIRNPPSVAPVLCMLAALLALAAWPAPASADSAVLLPALGGDPIDADTITEVRRWAREILEGEGYQVFDAADVARQMPEVLRTCGPADRCAFELRAVLGADVAVGISLEAANGGIARVRVSVTGARGVAHRAEAVVDPEAGLPFALAAALRSALSAYTVGRSVDPQPSRPLPPPTPALRVETSPWNWVLGGFLVLGSAPMLGYAINTAAREGECVRESSGGCTSRVRFQEGAGIFTAVGVGTLLAGVIILVTRPIPVFIVADSESAALHWQGTF